MGDTLEETNVQLKKAWAKSTGEGMSNGTGLTKSVYASDETTPDTLPGLREMLDRASLLAVETGLPHRVWMEQEDTYRWRWHVGVYERGATAEWGIIVEKSGKCWLRAQDNPE